MVFRPRRTSLRTVCTRLGPPPGASHLEPTGPRYRAAATGAERRGTLLERLPVGAHGAIGTGEGRLHGDRAEHVVDAAVPRLVHAVGRGHRRHLLAEALVGDGDRQALLAEVLGDGARAVERELPVVVLAADGVGVA